VWDPRFHDRELSGWRFSGMWYIFFYQEDGGRIFVWYQEAQLPKICLSVEELTRYTFLKDVCFKDTRSTRQDIRTHVIVFYDVNLCSLFEICQPFGFRQSGYGDKFTKLHGILLQKTTILLTAMRTSNHGGFWSTSTEGLLVGFGWLIRVAI
jgi:hypothetical protein